MVSNVLLHLVNNESEQIEGWSYSLFYIIGYTLATFLFQIVLKALLERRKLSIIKKVFTLTIPLTILSFLLGAAAIPGKYSGGLNYMDFIWVGLAFVGVFVFNVYDEKPPQLKKMAKMDNN